MFELSVKSHFSGAHHLTGYRGSCAEPHGHNWEIEVFLRGTKTNSIGMLVDFKKVKAAVHECLKVLDHRDLNRLPAFIRQNPTSENLARYLYQALSKRLNSPAGKVHRVWVCETPGSAVVYWEDA